jgi:hypothetical protein
MAAITVTDVPSGPTSKRSGIVPRSRTTSPSAIVAKPIVAKQCRVREGSVNISSDRDQGLESLV